MQLRRKNSAFTVVELLVVITIIAILAGVTTIVYLGIQHRAYDARTLSAIAKATQVLDVYYVRNHDYPPNFANTEYVAPESVALTLYTNAPQKRVYTSLTPDQNAQLLLNSCNASMPVQQDGTVYNTGCMFSGQNFHVKGNSGYNVVLNGPTVIELAFQLSCGSACTQVRQTIVDDFLDQGGSFPITVPNGNVKMPIAETMTYGQATDFCLEAKSVTYDDIVYHTTQKVSRPVSGLCPESPSLHYP